MKQDDNTVKRKCPICKRSYRANKTRLKYGRQTTCSRECSYILRARKSNKSKEYECPVCGKKFSRSPSWVKSDYLFCSPKCHYLGRSLGFSQRIVIKPYIITEEGRKGQKAGAKKTWEIRIKRGNYKPSDITRFKMSKSASKVISEGRIKRRSKLEYRVERCLHKIGITAIPQYPIRARDGTFSCCFDFFIPERNIALEVNGTFWHSDPRYFPKGPIHKTQRRNAGRWKRKLSIAKSLDIDIRVIWESDIHTDLIYAITRALGILKRRPSKIKWRNKVGDQ